MALLNESEKKRIALAVAEAEKTTGGEIVTAVISESDDYASRELIFGVLAGLVTFALTALLGAGSLQEFLDGLFWESSLTRLPLAMAGIALTAGAAAYFAAQIPAVDRLVAGRKAMAEAVRKRALRHFVESAAYDTRERTGILLFISVLERRVELIADKGINDKAAPKTWDNIVSRLTEGIAKKQTANALEEAVRSIGAVLAEHVPPREDDENELSDGPDELKRGS